MLQSFAIAMCTLTILGPTKESIQSVDISRDVRVSVNKENLLFKGGRTIDDGIERTFDVMVTPAGTAFGTHAATSDGEMKVAFADQEWFELDQGWIIARLNPDTAQETKGHPVNPGDWLIARVEMLDAGAEGSTFGVIAGPVVNKTQTVDIMLLDGKGVWAAPRGSKDDNDKVRVKRNDASAWFIRATLKDKMVESIERVAYTQADSNKRAILVERSKVWSARKPPE
jgi:hypothetical protein